MANLNSTQHIKICITCGTEYIPNSNAQKVCSKCHMPCVARKAQNQRLGLLSNRTKSCLFCGALFSAIDKLNRYKICSSKCKIELTKKRNRQNRLKVRSTRGMVVKGMKKPCDRCNMEVVITTARQMYCDTCKVEVQRESARKRIHDPKLKEDKLRYNREYSKRKKKADPLYALSMRLRARTSQAFSRMGYSKRATKTEKLLGAPFDTVKRHIENQFAEGMSWSCFDKIHIDHIVPLCSARDEAELRALCHYTNLQPLWARENMRKGGRVERLL